MNNNHGDSNSLSSGGTDTSNAIVNPPSAACISLPEMETGRDEMNLAEFPLAGLSNRSPKEKTLVFEASTRDKRQGADVRKRLTVAASAKYGLPTASDDEVILGLVQFAKACRFTQRTVAFVPAELFRLLGWRDGGRSYSRLETSLKRWLGVTLYYDHAWWDKQRQAWVDEHFHLLENVTVWRRSAKNGIRERRPWLVTWNEVVFRSFQAGYLKKLDMTVYRKLRLAASKRMYRFLDKRFYYTNRLTFDLRTFACEHIGFRRLDDNSQLKRRLNRAIDELERVGFLEPLPNEKRYRRICHGRWEVLFVRKRTVGAKKRANYGSDPREAALVKRGVRPSMAARLVREHSDSAIHAGVSQFDELTQRGRHLTLENPPGLLVALIREGGESAIPGDQWRRGDSAKEGRQDPKPTQVIRKQDVERETQARHEQEAVRAYLGKLPSQELESLEVEALSQASPFHAECYRRSSLEGNHDLLREYRDMIIEAHVRKLPGLSSK